MRFSWTQGRGMVALSAAIMALYGAQAAVAQQFVPYNAGGQNQSYAQNQAQAAPQYTAMAFQGSATRTPALNQPVESIGPGQMQSAPVQSYSPAPAAGCNCQSAPVSAPPVAYSQPTYTQPASAPMAYESYPSGAATSSSCGTTYNTFDSGSGVGGSYVGRGFGSHAGGGYLGAGLGGRGRQGGRRWYGGVYGLYMERDGNPWKSLAFSTPEANPDGYYPTDNEFVLNLTDLDNDTFAGAEFRIGSTLGDCGNYGWEGVYWGLLEEEQTVIVTDTAGDGNRLYTMLNQAGVRYDADGAGAGTDRSANDYFEYAPPVNFAPAGDEIRIRQITATNRFSMQNVELNMLRMSLLGGGYYSSAVGSSAYGGGFGGGRGLGGGFGGRALGRRGGLGGCGGGGCASGGCATGGCDSCAGGSACGGGCCGSQRYSLTGVFGVRYLRFDEDFLFRTDFDNVTQGTTGFLSRNVDVDNHLVGAQFGMNGIYRLGSTGRWALNLNSVVGVYGNHMEVWNRMDAPTAGVVTLADGTVFDLRYEDDDIAMIGELRAGGSYQYSCNWRLFGGYRLVGISGVALAFDQIAQQNATAAQVQYVDSDGSIFIHGLQGGVEFTY